MSFPRRLHSHEAGTGVSDASWASPALNGSLSNKPRFTPDSYNLHMDQQERVPLVITNPESLRPDGLEHAHAVIRVLAEEKQEAEGRAKRLYNEVVVLERQLSRVCERLETLVARCELDGKDGVDWTTFDVQTFVFGEETPLFASTIHPRRQKAYVDPEDMKPDALPVKVPAPTPKSQVLAPLRRVGVQAGGPMTDSPASPSTTERKFVGGPRKPSKQSLKPETLHVQVSTSREASAERNGPRNLTTSGSSRQNDGISTPTATSSTPFPPRSPSGGGPTPGPSLAHRTPQTQGQVSVSPQVERDTPSKYHYGDGLASVTELPSTDRRGAALSRSGSRSVPPGFSQEGSGDSPTATRGNGFMRKVKDSFSGRQPPHGSTETLSTGTGSTVSYIDESGSKVKSRPKRAHIGGGRRAAGGTQLYAQVREQRLQEDEMLLRRLASLDVKQTVPVGGLH